MDRIKKIWQEKKKLIIIILVFLLILLLIFTKGFGLFKSDSSSISSKIGKYNLEEMDDLSITGTFSEGNTIKTFGRVTDYEGSDIFTLVAEDRSFFVYLYDPKDTSKKISIDDISNSDYVAVEGVWDDLWYGLVADKVVKLDTDMVEIYLASKIPMLEIEILNHTENITHTCFTPVFNLRLTNTGQIPISHRYMHTTEYGSGGYRIYYFIDDNHSMANANREDYDDVKVTLEDPKEIGLLSNQGFTYFDDILPGQSVDTEYWAGGLVTESLYRDMFNDDGTHKRAGVGGSPNVFGNYDIGGYEFSFAWARMNNFDDVEFLNRSNTVKVNLMDTECSLADEYISDIFWVEPF